ncbi:Crp/Fnr family transcriptional regulator [Pararhodonellum marinum]|uniref:Crp/Fnr family transcriptional regulator n=1 Tax=Pararhodonellum marinum TaxID=2755358 RepID=UPI00188FEBF1|nr:Crp/Fnr family transcriptional regulator [Pararhodonellum marinum]
MHPLLREYFQRLSPVADQDIEYLSPYFTEKTYKKNEFLLREGEICKYNYFVISGCLRLFTTNKEGVENTRYLAFEGKFGTSFTSLISEKPAFENIQCLEKTTVLRIFRDDFYHLVETEPLINKVYRNILESAYITTQKRIYDFQGADSLERVQWLLEHQPKILSRLSNKVVASYLGITPYTLSRLKAKL